MELSTPVYPKTDDVEGGPVDLICVHCGSDKAHPLQGSVGRSLGIAGFGGMALDDEFSAWKGVLVGNSVVAMPCGPVDWKGIAQSF